MFCTLLNLEPLCRRNEARAVLLRQAAVSQLDYNDIASPVMNRYRYASDTGIPRPFSTASE